MFFPRKRCLEQMDARIQQINDMAKDENLRIWAHGDRQQDLYNERLTVIQERQDVLEGRIRAVDRWMMEIGSLIGAGVPTEGIERDTSVEGFEPESEDVSNDDFEDTLVGLMGAAWTEISGGSEDEQ